MRDVKAVGFKFYHVLYPKQSKMLLRECKFLCLFFDFFYTCVCVCVCEEEEGGEVAAIFGIAIAI